MEDTLISLMHGFGIAFQLDNLWYAFLGCLVGTLVGVLPGIGPLSGISILLPVTFGLSATQAVIMLAGIYYGSQYGGSTTSILMRIPGEASSVMTCIDGNAMAKKGRAGAALCIAAVGSWVAGTFGVIMLTMVAPPLATIALKFGPPEYTALLILGLIFLAYMSSTSLVRTLLMACIGLLLGMVGIDNMTGHFRYSFDFAELGDGIGIVPVAVGLFGLGEILSTPSHKVVGEVMGGYHPHGDQSIYDADRARQRARLHHRYHSRLGAYHIQLPVLCAGKEGLQASGGIRPWRGGRRRRSGIGE